MKPQRTQRYTLRTLKEYLFKDILDKIISCAIEVHSFCSNVEISESKKFQNRTID